jgi:hypothetical protein
MLIEVQALVDQGQGMNPRRVAVGFEQNRLAMLLAILHRHGGVATQGQDVFVNAGRRRSHAETAADLAVMLSAASSLRDQPLASVLSVWRSGTGRRNSPVPWRRAAARSRETWVSASHCSGGERAPTAHRWSAGDWCRTLADALARAFWRLSDASIRGAQACHLHNVVGGLHDFDSIGTEFQTGSGFRNTSSVRKIKPI